MALTIPLSPEAQTKLNERAAAAGKDAAYYAAEIVEAAVTRPTLDEVLAPVREEFARSGITEAELTAMIEDEKHQARQARRRAPHP
jgi:hypothetical protein